MASDQELSASFERVFGGDSDTGVTGYDFSDRGTGQTAVNNQVSYDPDEYDTSPDLPF